MPRQIRKLIMFTLAALIIASAPLTALAARDESTGMETALVAVKNLIDVDDDVYTEFSYGSSYSNYQTREGLIWSFSWSDAAEKYIHASATADGTLLNFRKFSYQEKSYGFAEVKKDAAIKIAGDFLKAANPNSFSYYSTPSDVSVSIGSSEYSLVYYSEVNGYRFDAAQISISVNKFTGEVTYYYTTSLSPASYKFENATQVIGEDDAVKAYADKIGLSLSYRSYYDYESGKLTVFPVYTFNSTGDRYISAVTGEVVNYVYDRGGEGEMNDAYAEAPAALSAAVSGSGESARSSLTPAEISALDEVGGFITSEQALEKLYAAAELGTLDMSAFNESSIRLNRDYFWKEKYYYEISLYAYNSELSDGDIYSVYGRVDAATGRVLAFSYDCVNMPQGGVAVYSEEQAEVAVVAFVQKLAPDEYKRVKLDSLTAPIAEPYRYDNGGRYSFFYARYENGAPFRDNGISVAFDPITGKIMSYSLDWYDSITFPEVKSALTEQQAFSNYVAQNGFELSYITVGEGAAKLIYDFRSAYYIDPFTGKALDYSGKQWTESSVQPDYIDVEGHWSQSVVGKLLENGVYLWGGKFDPDKEMTCIEFMHYILLSEPYHVYADPVTYFKERGVSDITDAGSKNPVTKQDAVKMIAEYLGYGMLAEKHEWFVYPFKDETAPEYRGYIAVCYMLGIIGGDTFGATEIMTRADAAQMLHNLILVKS